MVINLFGKVNREEKLEKNERKSKKAIIRNNEKLKNKETNVDKERNKKITMIEPSIRIF